VPERPGDSRLLSSILTLLMRKRRGESEREPYPGSAQSGWGKGDWSRHQCSRLNSWLHTPLATTPSIGTRQSARPRRHPIVNPKTWASYAADHYQKKSQTIHQVDLTPLPGLWCKSCALFKRTLSSEHVAVTEATCTLVNSRRKPVKPWHQDVNPTDDVHSTGLERRSSSTSLH